LFPIILVREARLKNDKILINHEKIHIRQQIEMLVVFFYVWYVAEFLLRLWQYKNRRVAYENISFEREAYACETDEHYLSRRPFWQFLRYF